MAIDTTSGAATAVAYDTAANADAYFEARGIAAWTGTDAVKEAALVRGCQYLENAFRGRWKGHRATQAQALAWPRIGNGATPSWMHTGFAIGVVDQDGYEIPTDEVPTRVKHANFEAALLVLQGVDLEPRLARGGAVKRKMVKAGPVETETEYADSASTRDRITVIEGLLSGLVNSIPGSSFGNVSLVRA